MYSQLIKLLEKYITDSENRCSVIELITDFGNKRYDMGVKHGLERSQNRLGNGDMGG